LHPVHPGARSYPHQPKGFIVNQLFSRRAVLGSAALGVATLVAPALGRSGAPQGRFPVMRSAAQWRQLLGPKRYAVLREGATERPGSSPLDKERRRGVFGCAGCTRPLFNSSTKFDSGTGWPSFYRALPGAVVTRTDRSMLMERVEVLCSRCGGHLGHVFKDGPKPTGLRYCMNGLALQFRPV
jgi:peptide-methionine (R)-S-oxide reductase